MATSIEPGQRLKIRIDLSKDTAEVGKPGGLDGKWQVAVPA